MAKEALNKAEFDALLGELDNKLGRLRVLYEQYFRGVERIPPTTARKDVVRLIHRVENVHTRNTSQKFRGRSLVQKFNTYKAYWTRIERQIEEGTFTRDVRKARRNQSRKTTRATTQEAHDIDLSLDDMPDLDAFQAELEAMDADGAFDFGQPKPESQKPTAPAQAPAPSEKGGRADKLKALQKNLGIKEGGGDDARAAKLNKLKTRLKPKTNESSALPERGADMDQIRKLAAAKEKIKRAKAQKTAQKSAEREAKEVYDKLVAAKRKCNESTAGLTLDNVKSSLGKQREHLKTTRGAKDVAFNVVIKDGKAFLKPDLKK